MADINSFADIPVDILRAILEQQSVVLSGRHVPALQHLIFPTFYVKLNDFMTYLLPDMQVVACEPILADLYLAPCCQHCRCLANSRYCG
jgi:hypothetical protein